MSGRYRDFSNLLQRFIGQLPAALNSKPRRRRHSRREPVRHALESLERRTLLSSTTANLAVLHVADSVAEATNADAQRVQNLNYRQFNQLSASDVGYLTPQQLSSIPNSWWFRRMSGGAREALSADQVQALNVGRLGLRYLNSSQVDALTVEQIQSVWHGAIRYLNPEQIPHLTTRQIARIRSAWWMRQISNESRAAFSAEQVQALNIRKVGLRQLSEDQVGQLSVEQVQSLRYRDFQRLSARQIPHLTTTQVSSMRSQWWFRRIPKEARAALTPTQVKSLNVGRLGLRYVTSDQIEHLSVQQIQSVWHGAFRYLNPEQIPHLTQTQIGRIRSDWWLRRIPNDARAALTPTQIQALNVQKVGLRRLTSTQIAALTTEQIKSLQYRDFIYLNPRQTPQLTSTQISSIPNQWWFRRMPGQSRAALTANQVQSLDIRKVGLRHLTKAQIDGLSVEQVQSIGYRDFRYLTARQAGQLTPGQVSRIPNQWWFRRMSKQTRAALGSDQVRALNVGTIGLRYLTGDQVDALTVEQIQSVWHGAFRYLSVQQIPHLTTDQVSRIRSQWWFRQMSKEARGALTTEQVRALKIEKVGLRYLTRGQIDDLSVEQIQSLGYRDFRNLTAKQASNLTTAQVASIPNDWWFRKISGEARAALTNEQVRALNIANVGLRYLTTGQIDAISVEQIQSLGYRDFRNLSANQVPHLTAAQVASIPNDWWFRKMSDEARGALTTAQVQALNVQEVGLRHLTQSQIGTLSIAQVQSLSFHDFRYLNDQQAPHLTAEQIAGIRDSWYFKRMSREAREVLSPVQIQSLNTAKVSIKYLTSGQRQQLTASQIQALDYRDFRYLTAEQVTHLTEQQMASISSYWHMRKMSDEARAALSRHQLLSLRPGVFAEMQGLPRSFAVNSDTSHSHDQSVQSDSPHGDDSDKMAEHMKMMELVPREAATHVTIATGDWSNPLIWQGNVVPGEDADVLISESHTVTFDTIYTESIDTVRVDGTLQFAHNIDTQLMADTIVVHSTGVFRAGSENQPIEKGVAARVVFGDNGPIDTDWDPLLLSRGLLSHGRVEMYGQQVTPYVSLAVDPLRGDTQLILNQTPVNWEVGHRLVLTGTSPYMSHSGQNQDEELEIVAINGNVVTIDQPLKYNHRTPEGYDLSVYVANVNRNVVLMSQNPELTDRRGHVMFMHNQNVQVHNVGLYGLGRTDKRNPLNDAILDENGKLIEDTGLNPRARYPLHFHRAGTTYEDTPGSVTGSVVVDSPGWGYVNHESYVNIEDNVAFHVVGASFVTEFGNEIGSFRRNLSIHTTGSGDGLESREDIFDFGHQGHGFWFQGPGVEVEDNIAAGNRDAAFIFFTESSKVKFDAANLDDPSLAAGREKIPVGAVPLKLVKGNVGFASRSGLETWFHLTNMNDGRSVIEDFTSWNNRSRGIHNPYTGNTTLKDVTVLGNLNRPQGVGISRNKVTNNMIYDNARVEGFDIGISVPVRRSTVINGGNFLARRAIHIQTAVDNIREVDINGDITFQTLTDRQLRGHQQFDIFMDGRIQMKHRNIETLFTPDIVRLGTVRFNGKQLYYHKQAQDFVLFKPEDSPDFIPPELIGKTNRQLWDEYGLAPGGIIAPDDAVEVERINGLVGSRSTYPPRLKLRSRKYTNELDDYQLRFFDGNGDLVVDATPVDLREGWNLITREVHGQTRTFFVFGDTEAPTFQLGNRTELVVNPEGLEFGFVVRGTVFDNSFGHMSFKKKFKDLEEREIHTRADGSQYIILDFTIRDFAGNTTDIVLELNLDPNAPLVPGTGQRDLPPRELPKTLYELLEYYMITGQTEDVDMSSML